MFVNLKGHNVCLSKRELFIKGNMFRNLKGGVMFVNLKETKVCQPKRIFYLST